MIFDDVEDPNTIQPYLPEGAGSVIYTTRDLKLARHLAAPKYMV